MAQGTRNWRGGPTVVGERGPELVNLPKGSEVIPNDKLSTLLNSGNYGTLDRFIGRADSMREIWGKTLSGMSRTLTENTGAMGATLAAFLHDSSEALIAFFLFDGGVIWKKTWAGFDRTLEAELSSMSVQIASFVAETNRQLGMIAMPSFTGAVPVGRPNPSPNRGGGEVTINMPINGAQDPIATAKAVRREVRQLRLEGAL